MDNWVSLLGILITLETTLMAGIWGFSWFLSKKFNDIYEKIQETLSLMIEKLEYHEQHDDKRFSEMTNGLWEIRVAQAQRIGLMTNNRPERDINGEKR